MASPSWGQYRLRVLAAGAIAAGLVGLGTACSGDSAQPDATAAPGSPAAATATLRNEATATLPPTATATATPPAGGAGGRLEATVVANPTPLPPPAPVPADWQVFKQAPGRATAGFTLRLPPGWFISAPAPKHLVELSDLSWVITSWDAAAKTGGPMPSDGLKIDISSYDSTSTVTIEFESTLTTEIAGVSATWGKSVPAPGGPTNVTAVYNFKFAIGDIRYGIQAFTTATSPGKPPMEAVLAQILASLKFDK